MFLDMTIHDFDMARFQIGEVEEVYAIGDVLIDPELNDIWRRGHGRRDLEICKWYHGRDR